MSNYPHNRLAISLYFTDKHNTHTHSHTQTHTQIHTHTRSFIRTHSHTREHTNRQERIQQSGRQLHGEHLEVGGGQVAADPRDLLNYHRSDRLHVRTLIPHGFYRCPAELWWIALGRISLGRQIRTAMARTVFENVMRWAAMRLLDECFYWSI